MADYNQIWNIWNSDYCFLITANGFKWLWLEILIALIPEKFFLDFWYLRFLKRPHNNAPPKRL
ncbi:hypothetical protein BJF92_18825 [Rhizobium rhizosphaerae]|uniref:Uncharacterized protein n=1 Tax=Xaviernesmea rhizosphaerae TaxID=1672749 RepID=A0A1Q9ADT3_9HYPH|nr:hypothetical protein BJF92_18825 [Xaviernesmea rhizosphaerae]